MKQQSPVQEHAAPPERERPPASQQLVHCTDDKAELAAQPPTQGADTAYEAPDASGAIEEEKVQDTRIYGTANLQDTAESDLHHTTASTLQHSTFTAEAGTTQGSTGDLRKQGEQSDTMYPTHDAVQAHVHSVDNFAGTSKAVHLENENIAEPSTSQNAVPEKLQDTVSIAGRVQAALPTEPLQDTQDTPSSEVRGQAGEEHTSTLHTTVPPATEQAEVDTTVRLLHCCSNHIHRYIQAPDVWENRNTLHL